MTDERPSALSPDEFNSLREVSKGDAQREIPQLHWERLVGLGYAVRRLGELGLTGAMGVLWVGVNDALRSLAATIMDQPFTPERVLEAIEAAGDSRSAAS